MQYLKKNHIIQFAASLFIFAIGITQVEAEPKDQPISDSFTPNDELIRDEHFDANLSSPNVTDHREASPGNDKAISSPENNSSSKSQQLQRGRLGTKYGEEHPRVVRVKEPVIKKPVVKKKSEVRVPPPRSETPALSHDHRKTSTQSKPKGVGTMQGRVSLDADWNEQTTITNSTSRDHRKTNNQSNAKGVGTKRIERDLDEIDKIETDKATIRANKKKPE